MPKKQNGYGNVKSFAFKDFGRIDKGKGKGAAGSYPSNREYGSSVKRTVIEKWNLDSNWVKWRKGYEYYNRAAWYRLQDLDENTGIPQDTQLSSVLYQGTPYETNVVFDGYKFATKAADSNNHYVMKRTSVNSPDLGIVTSVLNDPIQYKNYRLAKEIHVQSTSGADSRLLLEMIGERITDGETTATLDFVLNSQEKPALYTGKTNKDFTQVKITLPLLSMQGETIDNYQTLVGKVVWVKDFFVEKDIANIQTLEVEDDAYTFNVDVMDERVDLEIEVLDPTNEALPPSIYEISSLPSIFTSDQADLTLTGKYEFDKQSYQRFWGKQYLTGDLIVDQVSSASYSILPFTVLGVEVEGSNLILKSVPLVAELKMYSPADDNTTLIFTDYSFTKLGIDEYDGEYYHESEAPNSSPWMLLDTDVDPWMDEVFTSGNSLRPATTYTCSCPNHSQSILRAPQESQDNGERRINRQRRYPLPTVLGKSDYDALATNRAAGLTESWESREHKMGVKMCKHSIAAMFIDKIKVKEPNSYPTSEAREAFEEKLTKEIEEVGEEFNASYKRGGITTLEVVFALAQGLNLDDVELAYILLNSNF